MRTIETGRAIVDIVAWPEDRPWEGRYQTSSQIEGGLCRLVLSPDVFTTRRAPTPPIAASPGRLSARGLPAERASSARWFRAHRKTCSAFLTTTESVFNSACSVGKFYVVESGIDERRRLCAVRVRDQAAPITRRRTSCNMFQPLPKEFEEQMKRLLGEAGFLRILTR